MPFKYSSGSLSPGAKFHQSSLKIRPAHVEQFLRHKSSNSVDHLKDSSTSRSICDFKKPVYTNMNNYTPNISNLKFRNHFQMSPSVERASPKIKICDSELSSNLATNPQESDILIKEGDENIQERLSDLYSTARNVSVRAPKVMTQCGVTQSRHFSSYHPELETYNSQSCHNHNSSMVTRSYFTEYNKENYEPYQTASSEFYMSFGPKADQKVSNVK